MTNKQHLPICQLRHSLGCGHPDFSAEHFCIAAGAEMTGFAQETPWPLKKERSKKFP